MPRAAVCFLFVYPHPPRVMANLQSLSDISGCVYVVFILVYYVSEMFSVSEPTTSLHPIVDDIPRKC